MSKMSREKGKRGERELVNLLKKEGWVDVVRHWGIQSEKKYGVDVSGRRHGDFGAFDVAFQVKFAKAVDTAKALAEAIGDAEGRLPALASRKVPAGPGRHPGWIVSLRMEDFLALVRTACN